MTNEELATRIKAGIDVADNMLLLWQQCRRYIYKIALQYREKAELEDLEQEGYLALYNAVDGFQPEKGFKFLTYAEYWIKQKMLRYIQNNGVVRIPVHENEKLREYKKLISVYYMQSGRKPSRREIAAKLNVSYQAVINLEKVSKMTNLKSTDEMLSEDADSITVGEMIPCDIDVEGDALKTVHREQLKKAIWEVAGKLPEQQGAVLQQRYKEERTLKFIGNNLGVTPEKVRQIEYQALRSLRCSSNARVLRSFLDERIGSTAYRHNGVQEFNRTWTSSTELAVIRKMMK